MSGDSSRYRAFISYSWKDKVWGERLHRWMERYRVPRDFPAAVDASRRLGKFFRDDADMPAGADIGVIVRDAIARSGSLIVVCSPHSANSPWVAAEIEEFRRVSPAGQVFAVIVDGQPNATDPAEECFPPQLRRSHDAATPGAMPIEPVGVDLRRDGRDRTCARLAAGLLGVAFDDLWQRDRRRAEARQTAQLASLSALSIVFATLLIFAVVNARNAHLALSRFFAERAWQRLDAGETLTAARYALAGSRLAPQNQPLYWAALGATMHAAGESLPALLHADSVTSAGFSPDGALVVSGGRDKAARLWRARDGALIALVHAGASGVTATAFSPDSRSVAVGDESGVIVIRTIEGAAAVSTLRGHEGPIVSVAFHPDGRRLVSLGEDHTIRVWSLASGKASVLGDGVRVWAARLSPDGSLIAAAREDGDVVMYDADRGVAAAILSGHGADVYAAAFSADGARLVTAGADALAIVWDIRTRRRVLTLAGHTQEIFDAAFSPDGERVVTAGVDQTARVWNVRNGAMLATLSGHVSHVTHALFSPDGRRILTAGQDGSARIWDAGDGALLTALRGHAGAIAAIGVSPDGATLLTGGSDGRVRLWSAQDSRMVARLPARGRSVFSVEFTRDGETLVAADESGLVQSWNVRDWSPGATFTAYRGDAHAAVPSSDGRFVLTAGAENARLWARGGALVRAFGETQVAAALSHDSARVATAGAAGDVAIWNAASGALATKLPGHGEPIRSMAFSPDDRFLATAGEDTTARIWNLATGAEIATLVEHRLGVGGVVFSPDGASLLTSSDDGTAILWDAREHHVRVKLLGHRGAVFSAAFSSDGRRIATASEDGSAKVWDARDGRMLATLPASRGDVFGVAFSPDAAHLATTSEEGFVSVWNIRRLTQPWPALAADACATLLGPPGRVFPASEIQSDSLLGAEWPSRKRDVCAHVRGATIKTTPAASAPRK